MSRRIITLLLSSLCALFYARGQDYAIDWFSLDGGGGTSSDAVYTVSGTIGQMSTGESADSVYTVAGGFWQAFVDVETNDLAQLAIFDAADKVSVSWPAGLTGYSLEQSFDALQPDSWALVREAVTISNGRNSVLVRKSGAAAFFRLNRAPGPLRLTFKPSGNQLVISWPAAATGFFLERNLDVFDPNGWALVNVPVVISNGQSTVSVPTSGLPFYYRLTQTPSPLSLRITSSGNQVALSWPAAATDYYLEQSLAATGGEGWVLVTSPVSVSNGQNVITMPATEAAAFFRLTQSPSPPKLTITPAGDAFVLSWPAVATGFYLEQTFDVAQSNSWALVNEPVTVANGRNMATVAKLSDNAFFRLTRTPRPPRLTITPSAGQLTISWAAAAAGYYLEENSDVRNPDGWMLVNAVVVTSNAWNVVTVPATGTPIYYRLTRAPSAPRLTITHAGSEIVLSWPTGTGTFSLQQALSLAAASWMNVTNSPVLVGNRNQVTLTISGESVFFRLVR